MQWGQGNVLTDKRGGGGEETLQLGCDIFWCTVTYCGGTRVFALLRHRFALMPSSFPKTFPFKQMVMIGLFNGGSMVTERSVAQLMCSRFSYVLLNSFFRL